MRQKEIVKSLAQLAWADGELVESERRLLEGILERLGCTPEEFRELQQAPNEPGTAMARLEKVLPTHVDRREAMRDLVTLAFCDGECSFDEFVYIERMARRLRIGPDELSELRDQALMLLENHQPG